MPLCLFSCHAFLRSFPRSDKSRRHVGSGPDETITLERPSKKTPPTCAAAASQPADWSPRQEPPSVRPFAKLVTRSGVLQDDSAPLVFGLYTGISYMRAGVRSSGSWRRAQLTHAAKSSSLSNGRQLGNWKKNSLELCREHTTHLPIARASATVVHRTSLTCGVTHTHTPVGVVKTRQAGGRSVG